MSRNTPVPYSVIKDRENNLVTTIVGNELYDENDKIGSGKLTPKPDDTHRAHLLKRAKEHIALANQVTPKSKMKSPSEKKSDRMRMKLRNRDGFKCPDDFTAPKVITPAEPDVEISASEFDDIEDAD